MQNAIQAAAEKAQQDRVNALKDYYSSILSRGYDHAKSYTNLIIAVGYGVFFSLWTNLRADLKSQIYDVAGFLMGLSVICFILWEVFQMIGTALHQRRVYREAGQITAENLQEVQARIKLHFERFGAGLSAIWIIQLSLTLIPGLAALAIFLGSYVAHLIHR